MIDINDYIRISESALSVDDLYVSAGDFMDKYFSINDSERDSFIRHTIINNIPFGFKSTPILFERIIQYLSDKLKVNNSDIRLIGSAKTGFSVSPPPEYGRAFGPHSDLDFSIINQELFLTLEREFNSWAIQFKNGKLRPNSSAQLRYWPANLETCTNTIRRGFIDVNKIPAHSQFLKTQTLNNSMFLIRDKLFKFQNISVRKASVRIYKSWDAFLRQLKFNTEFVIRKVRANL